MCKSLSRSSLSPLRSRLRSSCGYAAVRRPRKTNGATIAHGISPTSSGSLPKLRRVATSLALMLCVAGCTSVSSTPSVAPAPATALGNSYRLLLPAGTKLELPDARSRQQTAAIAINELAPANGAALELAKPLQLVSPAYIAERNAAEMTLLREIVELKEENARLRARR